LAGFNGVVFGEVDENFELHLQENQNHVFKDRKIFSIIEYSKNKYCVSIYDKNEELVGLIDRENKTEKIIINPFNMEESTKQVIMVKGSDSIALIRAET